MTNLYMEFSFNSILCSFLFQSHYGEVTSGRAFDNGCRCVLPTLPRELATYPHCSCSVSMKTTCKINTVFHAILHDLYFIFHATYFIYIQYHRYDGVCSPFVCRFYSCSSKPVG